jgi:hypothetical protein
MGASFSRTRVPFKSKGEAITLTGEPFALKDAFITLMGEPFAFKDAPIALTGASLSVTGTRVGGKRSLARPARGPRGGST